MGGRIHGTYIWPVDSSIEPLILNFSIETNEGEGWHRLAGGFRVEGDGQLEPGQARNLPYKPFGGAIPRDLLEDSDSGQKPAEGTGGLAYVVQDRWDSRLTKGVQKYLAIPPFGTGVCLCGEPEAELISG